MTTAKNEVLIGLLLKNCYSVGAMNLWKGRGVYWEKFWLVSRLPSITQVRKTLSSGFHLKIILPWVVGFKCIA